MAKWKYKLDRELMHHTRTASPPFRNAWLHILPVGGETVSELTVSAGYAWDGCTLAPDAKGTRAASCLHDAIYQYAEQIAAATSWKVRRVLRYGDDVFLERMLQDRAAKTVAYTYYWAVRGCGGAFHALMRLVRGPADQRRMFWRRKGVSR